MLAAEVIFIHLATCRLCCVAGSRNNASRTDGGVADQTDAVLAPGGMIEIAQAQGVICIPMADTVVFVAVQAWIACPTSRGCSR